MSDLIESSPLGSEEIHPAQEDLRNRSLSPQDGESGHRLSSSASSERLSRSLSPCAAIAHSRSGLPDESHSKLPVNVKTRLRQGCPLCEGAINGMCHRCLPVLRSKGHHKDLREADMETQYQQAFALGREARERVSS